MTWQHETANTYRSLNPDLVHLSDLEAEIHYRDHGKEEGRFLTAPPLPEDFSAAVYRELNLDLHGMDERALIAHYRCHGTREGRRYKEVWRDSSVSEAVYLRTLGNFLLPKHPRLLSVARRRSSALGQVSVAVVLNDAHCTGAPLFGVQLVQALRRQGLAAALLIPELGSCAQKAQALHCPFLIYDSDDHMLWHELCHLAPRLVYFNSCNSPMFRVHAAWRGPKLLHSHEIPAHFLPRIFGVLPDIVVSQRIADLWKKTDSHEPLVVPPFLSQSLPKLDRIARPPPRRRTILMCGDTIERKGIKLFAAAAGLCPEIDFLWIGGRARPPCFENIPNLRHHVHTPEPFPLFLEADALILTSTHDPCPYVVLEALALGLQVVFFRESCYADLTDCPGCRVIPGPCCLSSYVEACKAIPLDPAPFDRTFLEKHFSAARATQACLDVLGEKKNGLLPPEPNSIRRAAAESTPLSSELPGSLQRLASQLRNQR